MLIWPYWRPHPPTPIYTPTRGQCQLLQTFPLLTPRDKFTIVPMATPDDLSQLSGMLRHAGQIGRERFILDHDVELGWRVGYFTLSEFNNYSEHGHGPTLADAIRDMRERETYTCVACDGWKDNDEKSPRTT